MYFKSSSKPVKECLLCKVGLLPWGHESNEKYVRLRGSTHQSSNGNNCHHDGKYPFGSLLGTLDRYPDMRLTWYTKEVKNKTYSVSFLNSKVLYFYS